MKTRTIFDPHLEQTVSYNRTLEIVLITGVAVLLAALIGFLGFKVSLGKLPFEGMTYLFSGLVLLHAVTVLGLKRALTYFAITTVLSFLFEYVGVHTGVVFGRYVYTQELAPLLFGTVPVVIPLAYFMVIYPCAQMANLLLRGRVNARMGSPLWSLYAALLTALIMTAWDLVMDPVMSANVPYDPTRPDRVIAWIWLDGGAYFFIPFRNFFGWTLTTFTCSAVYRFVEPQIEATPYGRGHRAFLMLPILGYASLLFGTFVVGWPAATKAIAPLAMGLPLTASLIRLWGRKG